MLSLRLDEVSSVATSAQMFVDTGHGFNEAEADTKPLFGDPRLKNFQRLEFHIPPADILNLRFDPGTAPGQYILRNAGIYAFNEFLIAPINVRAFEPLAQIQSKAVSGDQLAVVVSPGSIDPQLRIALPKPIRLNRALHRGELDALLYRVLPLACLLYLAYRSRGTLSAAQKRVVSLLGELNRPVVQSQFQPLDRLSLGFYALIIFIFLVSVLLNLNGSSTGLYATYTHFGPEPQILAGTPKLIRSDEWNFNTPHVLNQALRYDRFRADVTQAGPDFASLIDNVPVKHFTTIFRPRFWGFFLLPVDYGYSVLWQAKALILLCGVYTLILVMSRDSLWALTGTVLFFFSACTQWAYSWPSDLPEMTGSLCLATVAACYLTVGSKLKHLLLASVVFVFTTIDAALCAYVPHLLPLVYVMLAIFTGWCYRERGNIFRASESKSRLFVAAGALFIVALVGALVFIEAQGTVYAISATRYPGKRINPAGTYPWFGFATHFFSGSESMDVFPLSLSNICEAAGFYWLAPFTLLIPFVLRLRPQAVFGSVGISLGVVSLIILFWLTMPYEWLGRFTLLNRTGGSRCLPALGIANSLLLALGGSALQRHLDRLRHAGRRIWICTMLAAAFIFCTLANVNQSLNSFVSPGVYVVTCATITLLTYLLLTGRSTEFAVLAIVPSVLLFCTINPVERGLTTITNSELFAYVHQHPDLLKKKWIVFSDSISATGFLTSTGCQVYTGLRYVPDTRHLPILRSASADADMINNLFYLNAHAIHSAEKSRFGLIHPVVLDWYVSPAAPALAELGIDYFAFTEKPEPDISQHLVPLTSRSLSGMWLYRRADAHDRTENSGV